MEREVTINIVAPVDCTEDQFKEWVEYCTGYRGGISLDNPLHDHEIEATYVSI